MILLLGNAPEPIWPIQAAGYSYVNSDSTATTALGRYVVKVYIKSAKSPYLHSVAFWRDEIPSCSHITSPPLGLTMCNRIIFVSPRSEHQCNRRNIIWTIEELQFGKKRPNFRSISTLMPNMKYDKSHKHWCEEKTALISVACVLHPIRVAGRGCRPVACSYGGQGLDVRCCVTAQRLIYQYHRCTN